MKIKKQSKGITLISLVITIVILLIIAGISINAGKEALKMAKLEALKTNMLLIQAKGREYVEDVAFKMGKDPDEAKMEEVRQKVYIEEAKLEKAQEIPANFGITNTEGCYWLTQEAQESWALNKIQLAKDERYLIQFKETDQTVEIYNTLGYKGSYSLTDIDKIEQ